MARLGEGKRDQVLAAADAREPFLGDLFGHVFGDDMAAERGEELYVADVEIARTDGLHDQPRGDVVEPQTTETLGELRPDQAELAHLSEELFIHAALLFPLLVAGRQYVACERRCRLNDRFLF